VAHGFVRLATVKPGSKLHFHLAMRKPDFKKTRELVWRGRTEPVQFVVEVGADQKPRTAHGYAYLKLDKTCISDFDAAIAAIASSNSSNAANFRMMS
jgi:hypothetical protein